MIRLIPAPIKIYQTSTVYLPDYGMPIIDRLKETHGVKFIFNVEEWNLYITIVSSLSGSKAWFGDGENEANELTKDGPVDNDLLVQMVREFLSAKELDPLTFLEQWGFKL